MKPETFIQKLLSNQPNIPYRSEATAFAPSNIALCKYWGKKNVALRLPTTSSLSISLGTMGTTTTVQVNKQQKHILYLNNCYIEPSRLFSKRLRNFLNLFCRQTTYLNIKTHNNIPTEAGLASSASGFAALTLALNTLYNWQLDHKTLSMVARLGSGSACRSLWQGFVLWHKGTQSDGLDSYAEPLDINWPELTLGLLIIHDQPKILSSQQAMHHTQQTATQYTQWISQAKNDLPILIEAIQNRNFTLLGTITEEHAIAFHNMLLSSANPPIDFSLPATLHAKKQVTQLRKQGTPIYYTQDAGPNLVLLFLKKDKAIIQQQFINLIEVT